MLFKVECLHSNLDECEEVYPEKPVNKEILPYSYFESHNMSLKSWKTKKKDYRQLSTL